MKLENTIRRFWVLLVMLSIFSFKVKGQIVLEADFTDATKATSAIIHPLNVYNRISPINGFRSPATANAKLCIVRPLGGKYSNGGADLSQDTYLWDEENKKFYTDFSLLKKQIDGVYNKGMDIHQIVLDNPSWAFQRDSLGNLQGGALKVSTYGNAEPPRDFDAWAAYLKEVMSFLLDTYGEEKISKIQFGIGREIGTEGHWKGNKAQFFSFYEKSILAIHEVLPGAKVGTHFLWGTSSKSWAVDFVKWSKTNDVHYDVLGVSYYPFYNRVNRTNFTEVYTKDFGVIKDIPEWNEDAVFEIHEFALIETMNSQGNGYESAGAKYQNSFLTGLAKMFFEHNIKNLFQWGTGTQYMPANAEVLKLQGNIYYKSSKSGSQQSSGNYVDGIFTKDTLTMQYQVMAYNYNASPSSTVSETVNITASIDVPPGTNVKYRSAVYNTSNGTLPWSSWQNITTQGAGEDISTVTFVEQLPAFSFMKYEFYVNNEQNESPDTISLPDRLVFYYPLESDGADLSEHNNDATIGDAVNFLEGKVGNAASFSYTEGSFLCAADSTFKYSYPTAYTIAFWVKVIDYSQRGDILQPSVGRTLLYSNGDLSFRSYHQKKSTSFILTEQEKDEWFHVAILIDQRDGQTQHKFYVNGVQRGTMAEGYTLETEKPQAIGYLIFGASSTEQLQRNFTGILDEIYMFNDLLSHEEITLLMNSKGLIKDDSGTTSIQGNPAKANLLVYPVPAESTLYIEGAEIVEAEVYNVLGVSVRKSVLLDNTLDISALNTGMYFLNVVDEKGNMSVVEFFKR